MLAKAIATISCDSFIFRNVATGLALIVVVIDAFICGFLLFIYGMICSDSHIVETYTINAKRKTMESNYIEELRTAIQKLHGVESNHVEKRFSQRDVPRQDGLGRRCGSIQRSRK